jgi:GMP synthase (glutamine-hydrolysing)
VIGGWPDGSATLFIHEDEVSRLPDDADPLLEGSDGVAAWRSGSALAVQFHPEATHDLLTSWAQRDRLQKLVDRAGADLDELLAESARRDRFTVAVGRALVGRWLDSEVLPRVRG